MEQAGSRSPSATGRPTCLRPAPFVGRQGELSRLVEVASGPPAVLVITGEAGIGKSRLARELIGSPELSGRLVLSGHCHALREPFPLGPLIEALGELGEDRGGLALSPVCGALRSLLPELSDRLPPALEPLGDPRAERHRVFRALREVLAALGPAVCVLEDLHWADAGTLEFLPFLASALPDDLCLVLTHRGGEGESVASLRALDARAHTGIQALRLELQPLSTEEVRRLAAALAGRDDVSEAFAAWLTEGLAGNPFAVEEVIRHLSEEGDLGLLDARPPEEGVDRLPLPPALRDSILARVARLGEDCGRLLRAAAVLGRPSGERLITQVAGLAASRAETAFRRALGSALLVRTDAGEHGFRHALAAQTIYEDAPEAARLRLHRRAARALQSTPGRRPLAEIAHHLKEARSPRWPAYAEAAANAARAVGDDRGAARLLEQALAAPGLPRAARVRMGIALGNACTYSVSPRKVAGVLRQLLDEEPLPPGTRGELRLSLSRLLGHAGDLGASRAEAIRAVGELRRRPDLGVRAMVNLAQPASDPGVDLDTRLAWLDRAIAAAPRDDRVAQITVLAQRAAILLSVGDPSAWRAIEEIPAHASTVEERKQLLRAYNALAQACLSLGHYVPAATFLAEAARIERELDHPWARLWLESTETSLSWGLGEWAGLEARLRDLSQQVAGAPLLQLGNQLTLGSLLLVRGELDAAEQTLARALEIAREGGFVAGMAAVAGRLARLQLDRGDAQAARELSAVGLDAIRASRLWVWARPVAPEATDALIACGDQAEAARLVDELAAGVSAREAPAAAAALDWCRGAVMEAGGPAREAAGHFARAEEAWSRLSNPYEALRARERRASCTLGRSGAGDRLLQRTLEGYEGLGAEHDARRVQAELRTRGIWRRGRRGYGKQLSPREAEVVELARLGKTNREIAAELFISRRTVDEHVASAIRKLGVSSKHALAAVALDRED